MDDTTNTGAQQPASDDQELAKVLAGVNKEVEKIDGDTGPTPSGLHFEDTPGAPPSADPSPAADSAAPAAPTDDTAKPAEPTPASADEPASSMPKPGVIEPLSAPAPTASPTPTASNLSPELESIKKDVIDELRPLVSKLNLPAEEKFNTILLIIRSTDDQTLLGPAHDAAKSIEDESKRAQALLDVIKEIDFFSNQPK